MCIFHYRFNHADLLKTAKFIQRKVPYTPDVLIVFGSGLGKSENKSIKKHIYLVPN